MIKHEDNHTPIIGNLLLENSATMAARVSFLKDQRTLLTYINLKKNEHI